MENMMLDGMIGIGIIWFLYKMLDGFIWIIDRTF